MMQRKILIALALMVFVAVTGSLILFTQGTWRAVAGDSLNEMIPAVEISGCSWNDVASVVPDQFEGSSPEFLAFERGYHRTAICPKGMVTTANSAKVSAIGYDESLLKEYGVNGQAFSIQVEGSKIYWFLGAKDRTLVFLMLDNWSPEIADTEVLKVFESLVEPLLQR